MLNDAQKKSLFTYLDMYFKGVFPEDYLDKVKAVASAISFWAYIWRLPSLQESSMDMALIYLAQLKGVAEKESNIIVFRPRRAKEG